MIMTFTFKIQLRDIKKPPVWRRLEIPSELTFDQFHQAIQAAFGWWDYHLYEFQKSPFSEGWSVKVPDENDEDYGYDIIDSRKTLVGTFLMKMGLSKFVYVYDFGDSWIHNITLEKEDAGKTLTHPICLGGKGACPQEDSGGPWGYEEIKRLFAEEPDSQETKEYREWMGLDDDEEFDPAFFDPDEANAALEAIKCKPQKQKAARKKKKGTSITLFDTTNGLNKGDILDFAEDLHLSVNRRLGLEKLRQAYANAILDHPLLVLCHLPIEDLLIIEKLADGKDNPAHVDVFSDYRSSLMVDYGMADERKDDDGYPYLVLGEDFCDAVFPLIKEVMDNKIVHARITVESYVEGLANLYGQVSRRMVKETLVRLRQSPNMPSAEILLTGIEDFSLLLRWIEYSTTYPDDASDNTQFYVSRYGWDFPNELAQQAQASNTKGNNFKQFTEMEIIQAARSPIPLIPNSKQEAFTHFLTDKIGLDEFEVTTVCHDLWYRMMHDGDKYFYFNTPSDYFTDFVLDPNNISGELRLETLDMLTDYLNNMPQWKLRGYSSAEIFPGKPISDKKAEKGAGTPRHIVGEKSPWGTTMPILSTKKVGRNDPCPCGSGKKYKNCCGKEN